MAKAKESGWVNIRIFRVDLERIRKRGISGENVAEVVKRILDRDDKGE